MSKKGFLQIVYGGVRDPGERRMPEIRHCRHCWGDCPGDCLVGESGQCIHGWNEKPPRQLGKKLLSRRWWHRVFWGW